MREFPKFCGDFELVTLAEDDQKITARYYAKDGRRELPSLEGLTPFQRMKVYENCPTVRWITVSVGKSDGSVFCGLGRKGFRKIGRKIFPQSGWDENFSVRGNRVYGAFDSFFRTAVAYNINSLDTARRILLSVLGAECLDGYAEFVRKPQLVGICRGRITNPEMLVRDFFKKTYHLTDIDWKTYAAGYPGLMNCFGSIANIVDTAGRGGLDYLMERYAKGKMEHEHERLMFDAVHECLYLDRGFNPKWSFKRLVSEHSKMSLTILDLEADSVPDEHFYEKEMPVRRRGLAGKVISGVKDLYREGKEMSHCIYRCYNDIIAKGEYLALSITAPERCTVGIRVCKEKVEVEQIHSYHNAAVTDKTDTLVREWVGDHSEAIMDLALEARKNKGFVSLVRNEDLPF